MQSPEGKNQHGCPTQQALKRHKSHHKSTSLGTKGKLNTSYVCCAAWHLWCFTSPLRAIAEQLRGKLQEKEKIREHGRNVGSRLECVMAKSIIYFIHIIKQKDKQETAMLCSVPRSANK